MNVTERLKANNGKSLLRVWHRARPRTSTACPPLSYLTDTPGGGTGRQPGKEQISSHSDESQGNGADFVVPLGPPGACSPLRPVLKDLEPRSNEGSTRALQDCPLSRWGLLLAPPSTRRAPLGGNLFSEASRQMTLNP